MGESVQTIKSKCVPFLSKPFLVPLDISPVFVVHDFASFISYAPFFRFNFCFLFFYRIEPIRKPQIDPVIQPINHTKSKAKEEKK